jgi:hypothetical protein
MRYLFGFLCVCALGVMPLVGCSETAGNGGTILCEDDFDCDDENECTKELCDLADGMCAYSNEPKSTPCDGGGVCDGAGTCVECNDDEECNDFNDCTSDTCDSANGVCNDRTPVADGTECAGGTCEAGACALSGTVLPCTEQGIRNAIAAGGDDTYTFDCNGPEMVATEAEIVIDNDVILDGEGNLGVDGNDDHRLFSVTVGVTAELHGFTVIRGATSGTHDFPERGGGISNDGTLTLTNSTVSASSFDGIFNGRGGEMTISNCSVSGNTDAGIWNDGALTVTGSTVSKNGKGIWNNGPLAVTNSTVSGNFLEGGVQNAEEGRLTLTNSTVSRNAGGGIDNDGTMTLTNSTVSGNMGKSGSIGGGIVNTASLTVISSTVANNSGWGDALYIGGCFPNRECMTTIANTLIQGDCLSSERSEALTSAGYNIESPGNTCGFDQTGDQSGVSAVLLDLQPLANKGGPTQTHAITTDSAAFNAGTCEVDEDQRGVTRPQGPACDVGAFELEQ